MNTQYRNKLSMVVYRLASLLLVIGLLMQGGILSVYAEDPTPEAPTPTSTIENAPLPTETQTVPTQEAGLEPTLEPTPEPTEVVVQPTPTVDLIAAPEEIVAQAASKMHGVAFEELYKKAQLNGSVGVIVGYNVNYTPEYEISDQATLKSQRVNLGKTQASFVKSLPAKTYKTVNHFKTIPYSSMNLTLAGLEALAASSMVTSIEENALSEPAAGGFDLDSMTDITIPQTTSTVLIGAGDAWKAGYTGAGQIVVVISSGVDYNHPMLAGKVISQACYSGNGATNVDLGDKNRSLCRGKAFSSTANGSAYPYLGNCPADACDSGTYAAGIIAGSTTDYWPTTFDTQVASNPDYSGVARDAKLIAIQVYSRVGNSVRAYRSDVIKALERVNELRDTYPNNIAAVYLDYLESINYDNQDTCTGYSPALSTAITNLTVTRNADPVNKTGIHVVVPSGDNSLITKMPLPACITEVVSVAATTDVDQFVPTTNNANFSKTLLAPGENVISAEAGSLLYSANLRSDRAAAAQVAGAFALIRSKSQDIERKDSYDALDNTGVSVTDTRGGVAQNRIRVGNALVSIADPSVFTGTVDDTNTTYIHYSGLWTSYENEKCVASAARYSTLIGNAANTSFTGAGVKLYYTSAPGRGAMTVVIDGVAVGAINQGRPKGTVYQQTWTSPALPSGTHKLSLIHASGAKVEVDAIEALSSAPSDPTLTAIPQGTVDNYAATNNPIIYDGMWSASKVVGAQKGTAHVSSVIGSTAQFKFTGTQFTLIYTRATNRGKVRIQIDGGTPILLDMSGSTLYMARYTSPTYSAGDHTVKITHVSGAYIDLDAIVVRNSTPLATGSYEEDNTNLYYVGNWTTWKATVKNVDPNRPSGGTYRYSNLIGSLAIFQFTGQGIELTYTANATRGLFTVEIDGEVVDAINQYSKATTWQKKWTSLPLSAGTHTLVLRHSSGKTAEIDAIQVLGSAPSAPEIVTASTSPGVSDFPAPNLAATTVTYRGAWTKLAATGVHKKTLSYSLVPGSSARFKFTGTEFTLLYTRGPGRGVVRIQVDGSTGDTLDMSDTTTELMRTWTKTGLSSAEHTVVVTFIGGARIDLDGYVTGTGVLAPGVATGYEETDANLAQIGTWTASKTDSHYSAGFQTTTNVIGSAILLRFSGRGVKIYYTAGTKGGIASVEELLDNGDVKVTWGAFSQYNAAAAYQSTWQTQEDLGSGAHTLRIRFAKGSSMAIDKIEINPVSYGPTISSDPAGVSSQDDTRNSTRIAFSGDWSVWSGVGPFYKTMRRSSTIGSSASLTFTGAERVSVLYTKQSVYGDMQVQIYDTANLTTPVHEETIRQYQSANYGIWYRERWDCPITLDKNLTYLMRFTYIAKVSTSTMINLDAVIIGDVPKNDDQETALTLRGFGYDSWEVNTVGATIAADDPKPSSPCAAQVNQRSVWFVLVPTTGTDVKLNTMDSDYDTVLSVWKGNRGALEMVACNNDEEGSTQSSLTFTPTANTIYMVLVTANGTADTVTGGNLRLNKY